MNIELRNIKIADRQSKETIAFTATIYIGNVKVGWARNDGGGGSTTYGLDNYHDEKAKGYLLAAESLCQQMAPMDVTHKYGVHQGREKVLLPMNLELFLDDIIWRAWDEREGQILKRKMVQHQKNSICIGNDKEYLQVQWTKAGNTKYTIDELLSTGQGRQIIAKEIKKQNAKMKEGYRILNTNIPEELFL